MNQIKSNQNGSFIYRLGELAGILCLLLMLCASVLCQNAFAEGSYQVGLKQAMFEYGSSHKTSMPEINRPIYVDILNAGEVINISAAGNDGGDIVSVEIYDPSGTLKTPGKKVLDATNGKVSTTAPFDAPLTNPYRFETDTIGKWEVHLFNDSKNATYPDDQYNFLRRFDITVTSDTSTDPDPRGATGITGRVYAYSWAFNGTAFDESKATDADFYAVADGGFSNTYYIWKLDLNKFAGFMYDIVANNIGITEFPGFSVANKDDGTYYSVNTLYPIYLSYPKDQNFQIPTTDLTMTYFYFIDDANVDSSISPSDTSEVQDEGFFNFDANLQTKGVYSIIINTNGDDEYGAGDVLLMGEITGPNPTMSVPWDGRDNKGNPVPLGIYKARLEVRTGEFHFVANDVETSGGGVNNGLTIYKETKKLDGTIADEPVNVFWDDITMITALVPDERTTTLPDGLSAGKHTWGSFKEEGFGNKKQIDTYVYGAKARFLEFASVIIANNDTNQPPVATPNSKTTPYNTPTTLNVISDDTPDSDTDGTVDPATVDLDPSPSAPGRQTTYTKANEGTFTVNASGVVTFTPLSTFTGTSTIPYTVKDNMGATSNQANISITVEAPANTPPTAVNDSTTTKLNTPVTLNVVSNDTDPAPGNVNPATVDLDPATTGIQNTFTKTGEGTFTVNASGVVTFTPVTGFTGVSTIPYTVNDNEGATSDKVNPAKISITVTPNTPPAAVNDSTSTPINTPVTLNIVANDTDTAPGNVDPATVDLDLRPESPGIQNTITVSGGTFTVNTSGVVTFTPATDFTGDVTIPYTVNDNDGSPSNQANISITVTPPANVPPVANNDSTSTLANTPVTLNIVTNDTDSDGTINPASADLDPATAGIQNSITVPNQGTFTVDGSGGVTFTPSPGFVGTVSIPYTVNDNVGAVSNQATITIDVTNKPPVANNDSKNTPVNTPVTLNIVANDTDSDGTINPATVDLDPATTGIQNSITVPNQGTFTVDAAGAVTFTPITGFVGTASIPYTVNDNVGATSNPAIITITTQNAPPVAKDDSAKTPWNTPVTFPITGNDSDPDGNLDITTVDLDPNTDGVQNVLTVPNQGTFSVNNEGKVTFTPVPGFAGTATIPYTIKDTAGAVSNKANISVTVENNPPVAKDDSAKTPWNTPVTLPVTDNDSDPDGNLDIATVDLDPNTEGRQTTFTVPNQGMFTVNDEGKVIFTPLPTFAGTSTIPYIVKDKTGQISNIANISVIVENNPPVAQDNRTTTPWNTPVTLPITDNDSDPDNNLDIATVDLDPNTEGRQTTFTVPNQGTFTVNDQGKVTFTPLPGFAGISTIPYTVTDKLGLVSNAANIVIEVQNNPPVAKDDSKTTPWNTPVTFPITDNDSDPDGNLDIATVDLDPNTEGRQTSFIVPNEGTFTVNDQGKVTFTPLPTFSGISKIPYIVKDKTGEISNKANISVTVENKPPVAKNDSAKTPWNTPVTLPVTDNDTDPDNNLDIATVDLDPNTEGRQTTFTVPNEGTFTVNDEGKVIFTPLPTFAGISKIPYTVKDKLGLVSNAAEIAVEVENHPPVAENDSAKTPWNTPVTLPITDNDSDPDDNLDISTVDLDPNTDGIQTSFTVPNEGTFTISEEGKVTFTPLPTFAGTSTIPYIVKDKTGEISNKANISVTVENKPPVAENDSATTPWNTPVTLPVTDNDRDPDGNLDITTVDLDPNTDGIQTTFTVPDEGTFTVTEAGKVLFTPLYGFVGTSKIPYTVADETGELSNIAEISVTVENGPPNAEDDSASTRPNKPVSIPVLTNDSDPNDDPLTIAGIVTQPENGTVTFTPDGTLIYTPKGNFTGTDTFVYEISDGRGGTDTATVTVVVDDTTPNAVADSVVTKPETPINVAVLKNDTDPEGEPLKVVEATNPGNGTAKINDDGTVTYTPNPGFTGTDTFTYTIEDPDGNRATATVTAVVSGKIPSAADDADTTKPDQPVTIDVLSTDNDPNGDTLKITHISKPANGTVTDNGDGTLTYKPDPGFSGTDTFTYTVCDDSGNCDIASVTVTVENAPPEARDDSTSTRPNKPVSIPVLTNDSDPNGDTLTIEGIVTQPKNGTVTFTPDGTLIYTPKGNFTGTDTFVYEISDGKGGTDTATVTVVVDDTTPTAVADSVVTKPETPIDVNVLKNDTDPQGDKLKVIEVTKPAHGTVEMNNDGTVRYLPEPGFVGTDTFTYTIEDPDGNKATATVTAVVSGKIPSAADDADTTKPGEAVTVDVLSTDNDPNGDTLRIRRISQPANGTVKDNGDGTLTYIPNPGFSGIDTFTYTVCDDNGNCDTASVTITVENAPPTAVDDSTSTRPGKPVSVPVLVNDSDPNGDPLTVTGITHFPSNGTVTFTPDGTVIYTPSILAGADFTGLDSFDYEISDGKGGTDIATVTIVVDDTTPAAVADSAVTRPDTPTKINVLLNDTDPDGDPLRVVHVSKAENGTVADNGDGTVTYTPNPGFVGTDSFTYMISDPDGHAETATVTVVVSGKIPSAVDDAEMTRPNTPVMIDVLSTDNDPNGDTLRITDISRPANGTVTNNGNGMVTYIPNPGFSGTDTFTYTVCDDNGNCDIAAVTVTIENMPPEPANDRTSTPMNVPISVPVLDNDTDPNQDTLKVTAVGTNTPPKNGKVEIAADGTVTYTPKPGFSGEETFDYTVDDGHGNTSTATVTVEVVFDMPAAVPDIAVTPSQTPAVVDVLFNDTDPNGGLLTVTEITTPANGTVEDNGDGTVTYTPNPGFRGTDVFTYTVCNENGNCNDADVSVVVENATPEAGDDSASTRPNTSVSVPVLMNDTDPNRDTLRITGIGGVPCEDDECSASVKNGTVMFTPDGTLIYTPNPGFVGVEIFTYMTDDGNGGTDTATVRIAVDNETPTAVSDSVTTLPDTRIDIPVLANDSDPDGDILAIADVTEPENGRVEIDDNGTPDDFSDDFVTYIPNPGFTGTDVFEYTVVDSDGNSDTATVVVTVGDDLLIAADDIAETPSDKPVTIAVLKNDTNPAGGEMKITRVSQAANGTITVKEDGTVIYTPNPGFAGTDTFTYTVCNGSGVCDMASVTVTVKNEPPLASDDSASTPPDTPVSVPVLVNDSDPEGDKLTVIAVAAVIKPKNGTVTFSPEGEVIYTPNPGFVGKDTFDYTISDGHGGADTALVTITVSSESPTAVADSVVTLPNTQVDIAVLANDSDPDGDPLTITDITQPANGTVIDNGDGTVTYIPDPDFLGTDTFAYTIDDGHGNTDTAIVSVAVNTDIPRAVDDKASTPAGDPVTVDVLNNDRSPAGSLLHVTGVTQPANGAVTDNGDGTVTYTPNPGFSGTDTFTYTVCDDRGRCDMASVTVTVRNTPPNAVNDRTSTPADTPVSVSVLDNDNDPDKDPMEIVSVTEPTNGTAEIDDNGTPDDFSDDVVIYTPNPGFAGTDTFEYTVSDGNGGVDTATVTVVVESATSPDAKDDHEQTKPGTPVDINVLANDSDPENDPLQITSVTEPANGTAVIDDNGTPDDFSDDVITYTPNPGFLGTDTFEYSISDGNGGTDTATVTVVIPHGTRPDARDDYAQTPVGTPVDITVLANDNDPEKDPLTVTNVTKPANGTVVIAADGTATYTPNAGFVGTDAFEYTITDGNGGYDTAVVTVTVTEPTPLPGTVSGRVFDDADKDGIRDAGEAGLEGVRVVLTDNKGNQREVVTSADGAYLFNNVEPGVYTVTETDPEGFESSTPNTVNLNVNRAQAAIADFGDYAETTKVKGSISGTVFDDPNANGIQDAGEKPLPGVRVYADQNNNGVRDADEPFAETDADGKYLITGLEAGDYRLRADGNTVPEGYRASGTEMLNVSLSEGQNYIADADFGYTLITAAVSGYLWNDIDGDGVQGVDESPFGSVKVILRNADTDEIIAGGAADDSGFYEFDGLVPGNYVVEFEKPAGYSFTLQDQGADDGADSDVNPTSGRTGVIRLSADMPLVKVDAGVRAVSPDITNTKTFVRDVNGEDLKPGDVIWYSTVIYNSGTGPAENVVFTDMPGPYVSLVTGVANAVTTTQGDIISGVNTGDTGVRIEIGTIQPGESVIVSYLVQVNSDAPQGVWISDQGLISGDNFAAEPTDFFETDTVNDPTVIGTVTRTEEDAAGPDVNIQAVKTGSDVNGETLKPGETVKYSITVTNDGPDAATNLTYTDSVPIYTRLIPGSLTTTKGTVSEGDMLNVFIGDLAPGETATIEFEVRVADGTPQNALISSQGLVSGEGNIRVFTDDPLTTDGGDSTNLVVAGVPYLEVYKSVSDPNGGSVNPGDILEYTVLIVNTGNTNVSDVVFYDTPEGYISLVPGTVSVFSRAGKGTVTKGNGEQDTSVEIEVGVVSPKETVRVVFQVRLEKGTPQGTVIPNQGRIRSKEIPVEPSDDPATETTDDPTVVIVVNDPFVVDPPSAYKKATDEGFQVIYWEMLWINDKNADAVLVHLEDTLPSELTYVEGSIGADYGEYWFDADTNMVMWEGNIPGNGGEVHIWYHTLVPDDVDRVENQACAQWDKNGNGDWRDEADAGIAEGRVCTDDPTTTEKDPTSWKRESPDRLMKPF